MADKTGGPAFPVSKEIELTYMDDGWGATGMTLRDYFAAEELSKKDGVGICDEPAMYARLADHCYRMADAMLAARGDA